MRLLASARRKGRKGLGGENKTNGPQIRKPMKTKKKKKKGKENNE